MSLNSKPSAKAKPLTIENFACDCLDVRELRRKGFFEGGRVTIGPSFRFRQITRMELARFTVRLHFNGRASSQSIRVSWTRLHFGGERPWFHCSFCEKRVAKLYCGLGCYYCRACVGSPIYASQAKSSQSRIHFEACKLRLRLGGQAALTKPFPDRPRGMHRRTYDRHRQEGLRLEASLSDRMKRKLPDYRNLVAYFS